MHCLNYSARVIIKMQAIIIIHTCRMFNCMFWMCHFVARLKSEDRLGEQCPGSGLLRWQCHLGSAGRIHGSLPPWISRQFVGGRIPAWIVDLWRSAAWPTATSGGRQVIICNGGTRRRRGHRRSDSWSWRRELSDKRPLGTAGPHRTPRGQNSRMLREHPGNVNYRWRRHGTVRLTHLRVDALPIKTA